ncbi:hypothetical protein [Jatrophihabitans fulvus]
MFATREVLAVKNRRITLLDIGLDNAFNASMQAAESLFNSLNADYHEDERVRAVDGDFIRSRDLDTVFSAMTSRCSVLHIQAHGDQSEEPMFHSSDNETSVSLSALAEWSEEYQRGIRTPAVIADGCSTVTGVWQRAVRDCLQGDIAYIGTSRQVGWYEGTVFSSAFYSALLRNRGARTSGLEQAQNAAERAINAYSNLTGETCPYKLKVLSPSRHAKRVFAKGS